jgi:hypothetical protein
MTFMSVYNEERGGFGPLRAPKTYPKREKRKIHKVLFIGWQVTGLRSNALPVFERTSYLWSNAGNAVDRK